MKIDSSFVGMESTRRYTSVNAREVSYRMNASSPVSAKDGATSFADLLSGGAQEEEVSLQDRVLAASVSRNVSDVDEKRSIESIKFQCMQYLLYWLFGGKRPVDSDLLSQSAGGTTGLNTTYTTTMDVSAMEYHAESEETAFFTTGKVVTADGREIEFNLDLFMSRSFEEYYEAHYTREVTQMLDPLVINLDTDIAGLSDQKFEFDLDCDGIKEQISMLEHGSGYLALDKNGDGVINDGSELFGTGSQDGFADLAMYDEDGNGWIDENDEIFERLLIWAKDADGNDQLYTLKEAGVGAVCLHRVSTDFMMNASNNNQTYGQLRSTGVFLYENGTAGSVQQLDLAI